MMEIYLVGGAVRNRLLGLPVKEQDWVVVGSSPDEMLGLGYRSVGRDFPVFLHPRSGEEYALARTERKTGSGHADFDCETEAVTLEEDLSRRDLTINAIAEDRDGNLIDPAGGIKDLENRVLRHVSKAFIEDPLRVLRVARFAALLADLGFSIHASTFALMQQMTAAGDLNELTPERVYQEVEKALTTNRPQVFFKVLEDAGAGAVLWPELNAVGIDRLARLAPETPDTKHRFAALASSIRAEQAEALSMRLKVPRKVLEFSVLVSRHMPDWCKEYEATARDIVALLYLLDAFRQPERFLELNDVMALITQAEGLAKQDTKGNWLTHFSVTNGVTIDDIESGLTGAGIGDALRQKRIERVDASIQRRH